MSKSFVNMAREFRADPSLVSELPPIETGDTSPSLADVRKYRPELYALLAVMIEEVVDLSLANRDSNPPFGLVNGAGRALTQVTNFYELEEGIKNSLILAANVTIGLPRIEKAPIYKRLELLCELFMKKNDQYASPLSLINAGSGTAVFNIAIALEEIGCIVRKDDPSVSSEVIADIARNSQAVINRVAAVNIEHLGYAERLLFSTGGEVDRLQIGDSPALELRARADGTRYVDFRAPITELVIPDGASVVIGSVPVQFETLGCPARAHLNGNSSINKLWEWAIAVAEQADLFTKGRS